MFKSVKNLPAKLSAGVMLAITSVLMSACGRRGRQAYELYNQGVEAYEEGNTAELIVIILAFIGIAILFVYLRKEKK